MPSPSGWFPGWIIDTETAVGPIQVLAVHLHPAVSDEGRFSLGAYFSTGAIRLGEMQTFHPQVETDRPTLAVGDFNESDGGNAVEWLTDRGFTDALPEFAPEADTWEWPVGILGKVGKRLDHILYSPELHCLEARVLREGASDHFPVVGVFQRTANMPGRIARER